MVRECVEERVVMVRSCVGFSLDFCDEWYYEGQDVYLCTEKYGEFDCAKIEHVNSYVVTFCYNGISYNIKPNDILEISHVGTVKIMA